MAFRFFKNKPTVGKPFSLRGMTDGLNGMARALENIEIFGGRTDWHDGVPLLIPPEFNGYTGGGVTMPFDVRINEANIEVYLPETTIAKPETFTSMNGVQIELRVEGVATPYPGWQVIGAHGDTSHWIYLRLDVENNTINPWTPSVWADLKLAAAGSYPMTAVGTDINFWRRNIPIAFAHYSGGTYTIVQIKRGHVQFDAWGTDSTALAISAGLTVKTRSLEPSDTYHGGFRIRGWNAPGSNLVVDFDNVHFLLNELKGGIRETAYISWPDLVLEIESIAGDVVDGEIATLEHNELQGLQGGQVGTPKEYYHLTESQHAGLTGALDENDLLAHGSLPDVVDQSVDDDHRGGRLAATAIPFNAGTPETPLMVDGHPLVHCNGDPTRNAMSENAVIGDRHGLGAIYPDGRALVDESGDIIVFGWGSSGVFVDGHISDQDNNPSIYPFERQLDDGTGVKSLAWNADGIKIQGHIQDEGGNPSVYPTERQLDDGTGVKSLTWDADGVDVPTGVYRHAGAQGVSGDGFSGGIKTDAAASEAATVALIELYT